MGKQEFFCNAVWIIIRLLLYGVYEDDREYFPLSRQRGKHALGP